MQLKQKNTADIRHKSYEREKKEEVVKKSSVKVAFSHIYARHTKSLELLCNKFTLIYNKDLWMCCIVLLKIENWLNDFDSSTIVENCWNIGAIYSVLCTGYYTIYSSISLSQVHWQRGICGCWKQ